MHRRRAVVLALLAAAARSTHAIPKDFFTTSRESDSSSSSSVCPKKDLEACPSSLPSGFCCPSGQQCQSLAGASTALCCPSGRSCEKVWPIACDLKLQDPKENPDATIITSVFDIDLETCSNGCCPFGYACADGTDSKPANRVCVRNTDQSKKPTAGKSSASSSKEAATSTAATSATTASSTAAATTSTPDSSSSSSDDADAAKGIKSKTMSMIGGVVGAALVLLILVVVAILCVRRRRRKRAATNPLGEKTGHHRAAAAAGSCPTGSSSVRARGIYISEPILQENSYRSDFILKSPSAASSVSQRPVNSRWSGGGVSVAPPRIPTPPRQQRRDDLEFPNPFSSPSPSMAEDRRYSLTSSDTFDETGLRTGHVVTGKPAPIRSMRPSSQRISREPQHLNAMADEKIDVFSDEYAVPQHHHHHQQYPYQQRDDASRAPKDRMTRMTTFSQLMDKADLGDLYRGKSYVPGAPVRI